MQDEHVLLDGDRPVGIQATVARGRLSEPVRAARRGGSTPADPTVHIGLVGTRSPPDPTA